MASAAARPRRSVLYMPGSNARAMEKARDIPADALILDLEDAVAPESKEEARGMVAAAVKQGGFGKREIAIRVNGLDTQWGAEDIKAAVAAGPDAILVPKINSAEDVELVEKAMTEAGAPQSLQLWCMIETPLAILNIQSIAQKAKSGRMTLWVMGTNDLAKELRAAHTPDRVPMLTSLGLSVIAARAYGILLIDGVYNDMKNEDGFAFVCEQGRDMGLDGKTLIHPSQVEPCNRIFSPDPETVAFARKTIAAFDEPENRNKGALKIDGKMVERLHAEIAKRTVAIADAIAELEAAR